MITDTANARQLSLFRGDREVAEIKLEAILYAAHQMRAKAIADMGRSLIKAVTNYFKAIRTERSLENLSDEILADIGISRDQIPMIAKAVASKRATSPATPVSIAEVVQVSGQPDAKQDEKDGQPSLPLAA